MSTTNNDPKAPEDSSPKAPVVLDGSESHSETINDPGDSTDLREQLMRQWPTWDWEKRS